MTIIVSFIITILISTSFVIIFVFTIMINIIYFFSMGILYFEDISFCSFLCDACSCELRSYRVITPQADMVNPMPI